MDRILALQGLASVSHDDDMAASNASWVCSSDSSGQGSGCSNGCGEQEQLDW